MTSSAPDDSVMTDERACRTPRFLMRLWKLIASVPPLDAVIALIQVVARKRETPAVWGLGPGSSLSGLRPRRARLRIASVVPSTGTSKSAGIAAAHY